VNDVEEWTPQKDVRDADGPGRGGDEGGGGGTATKTKVEQKTETKLDEPDLEVAPTTATEAPAAKPQVAEPEVKTASKTEEKTEAPIAKPVEETAAPVTKPLEQTEAAPQLKPAEKTATPPARPTEEPAPTVRTAPDSDTGVATEAAPNVSTSPGFKLQPRANSQTRVFPKVSTDPAVSTKSSTAPAVSSAGRALVDTPLSTKVGTRYPDEPPPSKRGRYLGSSGMGDEEKTRREELLKRPEIQELPKEPLEKVLAKEHEARKSIKKRNKIVGEDIDESETFIIGDLKIGEEKLTD
jgi:hypothetical protein